MAPQVLKLTVCLVALSALAATMGCQSPRTPFTPTAVKKPGNGKVYVYWPGQRWGEKSGQAAEIRIDGVPVGLLYYKRYLELELPGGAHRFSLSGESPEANWDGPAQSFTARVEAGRNLYIRLLVKYDQTSNRLGQGGMQYVIHFLPRGESEARREMAGLRPAAG